MPLVNYQWHLLAYKLSSSPHVLLDFEDMVPYKQHASPMYGVVELQVWPPLRGGGGHDHGRNRAGGAPSRGRGGRSGGRGSRGGRQGRRQRVAHAGLDASALAPEDMPLDGGDQEEDLDRPLDDNDFDEGDVLGGVIGAEDDDIRAVNVLIPDDLVQPGESWEN